MSEGRADVVAVGCQVTLRYRLALADGTLVDHTEGNGTASFRIGSGELVPFLERCLIDLRVGDHRHFEIGGEQTRSALDEGMVQRLPRSDFPAGLQLVAGQVIGFQVASGEEIPGQVLGVTEHEVTIDFSHPLAGRDLIFDVEIVGIEPG